MPPSPSIPLHAPPRWAWRPHAAGTPAETVARAWLATALAVDAETLALPRDARGRPRLGGVDGWDCNWSHSGDGLLVALAQGGRVGVDVERERERPRALAVAQRYFTADEHAWLAAQPGDAARDRAFLRLWCAKEAVLKAHGHGLSFGLHRLRFVDGDGGLRLVECDTGLGAPGEWTLQELVPAAGYVAALAWRGWEATPGN